MTGVVVQPTDFLKAKLDPISSTIDSFGGANVLLGCIASGGQPHVYIIHNTKGTLRTEMFEVLADKLREMARTKTSDSGLVLV